jgi:hypothetical protein
MVPNIVSDHQIFYLAILGELHEDFLIKVLKMVNRSYKLGLGHIHPIRLCNRGFWILVQVLEDHAL